MIIILTHIIFNDYKYYSTVAIVIRFYINGQHVRHKDRGYEYRVTNFFTSFQSTKGIAAVPSHRFWFYTKVGIKMTH